MDTKQAPSSEPLSRWTEIPEKVRRTAPVLSQIARAMFPFESSMEKTAGICSSLTLSIRKASVDALGSDSDEHPGNAA